MQLLSGEPRVEQPFFPVSKVRVRATDTGHSFRRHWAVVADDRREVFAILEVRPPAELPRNAGRRDAWVRLGPWLRGLGDKYRNELGATAYALVNAATDYASDSNAPLMSPGRVDAPGSLRAVDGLDPGAVHRIG